SPVILPSVDRITKVVQPDTDETVEELDEYYGTSYRERLYPAS
ncbi:MAG: hypothetical protein JWO75_4479, partial [Actinomycetia bacterium]|nr:hypothetical protein [Actinomycetes bacterium]